MLLHDGLVIVTLPQNTRATVIAGHVLRWLLFTIINDAASRFINATMFAGRIPRQWY